MRTLTSKTYLITSVAIILTGLITTSVAADPIPGRDILKFSQKPMVQTFLRTADGTIVAFYGHDELSTLYGSPDAGTTFISNYSGTAMADDFADRFDTPIVHVRWWGSYLNNEIFQDVDKFLITFESDLSADNNPLGFSRPNEVLLSQIVTLGPLFPGSGTYTETPIHPGGDPLFETLYEYNAELHLDKAFPQDPDTVYWIKIAALVDVFDPGTTLLTQWGWHNRDYTIFDPLASTAPAVVPGEFDESLLIPYPSEVWHFQDDAVSAETFVTINAANLFMPDVQQDNYQPQFYLDGIDGFGPGLQPDGTIIDGIGRFSKDLAFELYTIPEPASLSLLMLGGLLLCKKPRRETSR